MGYNLVLFESRVDELMRDRIYWRPQWRIGKNLGKTWSKNSMNLVWENLELNRKKHGLRKLGTGQVSSGGKCRQHTSFSLESKRKKILVTTFKKLYNFLLLTTWLIHFSSNILISPFSGTRSGVSVTRTKFARNYLRVKTKSKRDTFRPIATGLSGLISHMLNS